MYEELKTSTSEFKGQVNQQIEDIQKELTELRLTLSQIQTSITSVYDTVTSVKVHVAEINVKQDVAITAQDKFISQLWKAFFALLGIITTGGAAAFAFFK